METALYILLPILAISIIATIYFFSRWQKVQAELAAQVKTTSEFEMRERLALQSVESMKVQMDNWEHAKQEHMKAAQASMMEVTSKLSSKLLDDHKRESEAANKQAEEKVQKTTADLQQKFQTVFEKMKSLNDRVEESSKTADLIRNSLLSPQGAGKLTEITLENILANSGLVKGTDYDLQYTVNDEDGRVQRPDCVIYLPHDTALVVDCKSSKFFIEDDAVSNDQSLKQTLSIHLNNLISKDYRKSLERDGRAGRVLHTVMFLPSEVAVERIRRIDPSLLDKAQKNNIIITAHAGLITIISQVRLYIEQYRQEQNYRHIMDEVQILMDGVAKIYSDFAGIGKALSDGLGRYNRLSNSFDRKVFNRLKKINALGLTTPATEGLKSLPRYDFVKADEAPELKVVGED